MSPDLHSMPLTIGKVRVKLAKILTRVINGGLAGRLPANCVYSIQGSSESETIKKHLLDHELLESEAIIKWHLPDALPWWCRRSFAFSKRELFVVKDVVIGPASGVMWTRSGHVLAESIGSLNKILTFGKAMPELCMRAVSARHPSDPFEAEVHLACPPASYYHWLLETLPALILLLKRFPGARIVTTPVRPAYVDASLACLLGADSLKSQLVELNRPLKVTKAAFITMPAASGFVRPGEVELVHRTMLDALGLSVTGQPTEKLFISRTATRARAVRNQCELEERFRLRGYSIEILERLPWRRQVELFSKASHVAGLHGAGFANLVFAPGSCRVTEIFPPFYTNDCYARLASGRGMDYHMEFSDARSVSEEATRRSCGLSSCQSPPTGSHPNR